MSPRAILLSVLACLCLAPDAALAVEIRDATPNVTGSQVDPSVATTAAGGRLLAATDAGTSTVRVWRPNGPPTNTTWSNAPVSGAGQAALAWDGGATAQLATASSTGCGAPAAIKVRSYTVASETYGAATTLGLFAAPNTATQTWPRLVLGDPGDADHAGDPITVADEEDCIAGGHQIVVAWPGSLTRPVAVGRYPDVAVLGPNGPNGTQLLIAYLVDVAAGEQELRVLKCGVQGTFTLDCGARDLLTDQPLSAAQVADFATPGSVTVGSTTVDALAAPSLSCSAGTCHVAWTESASGGQRTRVFVSSASSPYTSWSTPQQVASSSSSSQLMPSVSAHGSRADVVYLDTRLAGASKFDAFQTSIAGAARGNDISLTNGAGYDPAGGASLGQRTSAAGFAAGGTTGVVRGYFPDASSDLGAVSEAELAHGTAAPTLPAAGIAPAIPKNTAYNALSWLTFADPDGDPVTVTVDDPAHGSVASGLYSPDPTYAGTDTVRVRATDGITPVFVDHVVSVTNQAPVLDAPAPAIVDEGGAVVTVPLHAVDPDFNDAITYGISFAQAPLNAAGRATIVGSNLQLDIPAGVRSMAPLRITLRARDSTTGIAPGEDYQ
ncbi:MAG: hypothetical protein QOE98_1230, partial [Gaiellaceae bacterium]|nr:hypothetical protein [Gaiellaceae bacterium]